MKLLLRGLLSTPTDCSCQNTPYLVDIKIFLLGKESFLLVVVAIMANQCSPTNYHVLEVSFSLNAQAEFELSHA